MRRAIPRPWPTVLSLGLLVGGEACLADDSWAIATTSAPA